MVGEGGRHVTGAARFSGSACCQPAVGGSLPPTLIRVVPEIAQRGVRHAAERSRLAACAPRKEK